MNSSYKVVSSWGAHGYYSSILFVISESGVDAGDIAVCWAAGEELRTFRFSGTDSLMYSSFDTFSFFSPSMLVHISSSYFLLRNRTLDFPEGTNPFAVIRSPLSVTISPNPISDTRWRNCLASLAGYFVWHQDCDLGGINCNWDTWAAVTLFCSIVVCVCIGRSCTGTQSNHQIFIPATLYSTWPCVVSSGISVNFWEMKWFIRWIACSTVSLVMANDQLLVCALAWSTMAAACSKAWATRAIRANCPLALLRIPLRFSSKGTAALLATMSSWKFLNASFHQE